MENNTKHDITVSVVIVNWNTCKITCDCLRSVYEQTKDIVFEVIVVDNASSDDSVEVIKREFSEVVIIENADNRGFAAANNQGMEIARGNYVLLLNSDTVVLDQAIEKTSAFADKHPEIGVLGCRILNPDMSLQPSCFMYPSILNMTLSSTYLYKLFPKSKFFGREKMTWWGRDDIREVDTVTGCFMLVRREAIDQVGVMDERYFVYGEETDWCYRFKENGWKVVFFPDAEIIHIGGQSSKMAASKMSMQLRGSILQFIDKHGSRFEYLLACMLVWLFFTVRIPFWFIRSLLSNKEGKRSWQNTKIYFMASIKLLFGGGKALCLKR